MQDDKTVIRPNLLRNQPNDTDQTVLWQPELRVSIVNNEGNIVKELLFSQSFSAGRSQDNDVVIQNEKISRHHLAVKKQHGDWWLHDLNSANGLYVDGKRVEQPLKLDLPTSVAIGQSGIALNLQINGQEDDVRTQIIKNVSSPLSPAKTESINTSPQGHLSKEAIKERLLSKNQVEDAGDFTRMVRGLIREDRVNRGKNYKKWITVLGILFLCSAGLVAYQQMALNKARTLALDMFYDIKTLEVSMSQSEMMIERSADVLQQTLKAVAHEKLQAEQERIKAEQEKIAAETLRLAQERVRLKSMKEKYQSYVQEAQSLKFRLPFGSHYEEELITRVAREFGESELELPDGFVAEVQRYIKYWQNSSRMRNAMATLERNNYGPTIITALDKVALPLQFMYLPMQESNYNTEAIGPETRYGVAKGAWQFLASTGQEYGLKPGPMANIRIHDDQDDRFNFDKASRAGARYLKYIYSTEAQASGLLVMAGYNYGHNRVKGMIKRMPDNPRDKNFWKFIQQYKIPKETYDYVFYIFSAAVIGEDPKHFGFNFKPPLTTFLAEQAHDK